MNYDFIKQVSSTKFLGVVYDQTMSFRDHINYFSLRLSRTAALIYRVKLLMPDFVLKKLYHAHVTSILSYCNIVWANTYPTHLDVLKKMQKKIIRNITNSDYLAHTAPLFNQLQLLNIDKLRKYYLGIYFYKNIRTLLPELQYLHNHFTRNRHRPRPEHHNKTNYDG